MSELRLQQLRLQRGERVLCEGLSLSLRGGQCWGVLGANGAGKSTLLHTLAGLYTPQGGGIELDGMGLQGYSHRQRALKLGLLFQDHGSAFPATVLETVMLGRHPHIPRWRWESAEDLQHSLHALQRLGLEALQQRSAEQLSGGERQRLAIATLLNQSPAIYLLDEPTNHLDLHHQIRSLELFTSQVRQQGRLVLMALHDLYLAQRFCDHFILMLQGGECLTGTAEEVLTSANLTRLYGHPMRRVEAPHGPLFLPD